MTFTEKKTLFFGAPSPLNHTERGNFKGGIPINPRFEGAEPLAAFGILGLKCTREGIEYGLNCAFCSPGHHQVFVPVTRTK